MKLNFKSMKTTVCRILITLVFCFSCFSYDGELSGEKDLRVIETKWFDIIFPPASYESAKILAQNADRIYEEVYDSFEMQPYTRMPIVIAPAVEQLNAFFTSAPYNHIVVYDTLPDAGQSASLAVFSENLLSVFKHECVHAVSFNLKSKGWRVIGSIFGDVINPAYLFVPPGLAEGTAVVKESENGEGRLNDGYSMQIVRQAKVENKFPAYADEQGASKLYPYGSHYEFNGAFYSWVRQKFGVEKFARFWYKLVNFQSISTMLTFRSIFGMGINDAWKQFRDELYVPNVDASPLSDDAYADVFNMVRGKDASQFSMENKTASRYISLTSSEAGIACVDAASGTVLFFQKKNDGTYSKPKTLFRRANISRISFSQDGKLLAVSYLADSGATVKSRVAIYDMKRHSFFALPETKLRDATIVEIDGEKKLVAVRVYSQKAELVLFDLQRRGSNSTDGKVVGVAQVETLQADVNSLFVSPTHAGDGNVAYILKEGNDWEIVLQQLVKDVNGAVRYGERHAYKLPEKMSLRSLAWDAATSGETSASGATSASAGTSTSGTFLFSCAMPDTFPRLARLVVNGTNATLFFQDDDVSGGVLSPVAADSSGCVFYSGAFFRNSRLLSVDTTKISFTEIALENMTLHKSDVFTNVASNGETSSGIVNNDSPIVIVDDENMTESYASASILPGLRKYNPLNYYKRGIFLPIPLAQTYSISGLQLVSNQLFLGLLYASSNPWNGKIAILSGGVRPDPLEVDLSLNVTGGTNTSMFKYNLLGNVAFDKKGFLQTFEQAKFSSSIPFGKYMSLAFYDTLSFFYGRSALPKTSFIDKTFEATAMQSVLLRDVFTESATANNFLILNNNFSTEISSIHKMGPSVFEYGGVALLARYNVDFGGMDNSFNGYNFIQNVGATAVVRLPYLLPIRNYNRHTYNLPTQLDFSLFPSSSLLFQADASVLLYAADIQKAVPALSAIFVNRFALYAEYTGFVSMIDMRSWNIARTADYFKMIGDNGIPYYDYISLRLFATLTPNFGMMSSLASVNLNARFLWYLSPSLNDAERFKFRFTFDFVM